MGGRNDIDPISFRRKFRRIDIFSLSFRPAISHRVISLKQNGNGSAGTIFPYCTMINVDSTSILRTNIRIFDLKKFDAEINFERIIFYLRI